MDYEKEFEIKDPKYRSSMLTNGLGRSGGARSNKASTHCTTFSFMVFYFID